MDGPAEEPVKAFYDQLAEDYHLIFEDWWRSVERQGEVLSDLISSRIGPGSRRILDCTCGIGTQSLGLSLNGHDVLGTDSSDAAVARAQREATQRGLSATFQVWDVRDLARLRGGPFDVVLSGDNSLPHLTSHQDLARAVREMWGQAAPGGAVVVTMREGAEGWTSSVRTCEYRALQRAELEGCFRALGAEELQWLDPSESGFFQQLLWAVCDHSAGERPGRPPGGPPERSRVGGPIGARVHSSGPCLARYSAMARSACSSPPRPW